ncbi:MAG: DUF4097 family beta strand repeat protein [Flammeovirgaceae bacterium]|nr:DUF4097 family beta strand repeat protein [Flammeovirgaceae bacterium]
MKLMNSFFLVFTFLICSLAQAQEIKKEFKVNAGGQLDVDSDAGGSISITGWEKSSISVEISHDYNVNEIDFNFKETANGLVITSRRNGNRNYHNGNLKFVIKVPSKLDLELKTSGGTLNISKVAGDLDGRTSGGSINLNELSGDINCKTSGGNISLKSVDGEGDLSTSGGNINIFGLKGEFDFSTSGGNISISDAEFNGDARTSGGNIKVTGTKGKMDLATSGGNISMSKSEIEGDVRTSGGNISISSAPNGGSFVTSGGNISISKAGKFIVVKTSGGNISVKELDGGVEAKTSGGNINIIMTGDPKVGDRNAELASSGGSITLLVPEGMDMDIDIELEITRRANKNYKIISDFPITKNNDGGTGERTITGVGKTGSGKNKIKLRTVNGDIYLKKA